VMELKAKYTARKVADALGAETTALVDEGD
jgi:hypothetical protein